MALTFTSCRFQRSAMIGVLIYFQGRDDFLFSIADAMQRTAKHSYSYGFPMILRFMFGCASTGETLIRIKDVDFDIGVLTLRHAKGNKQRLVPMHNSWQTSLGNTMAMGMTDIQKHIFSHVWSNGASVNAQCSAQFTSYWKELTFPSGRRKHQRGPCLHRLRHVFAFSRLLIRKEKVAVDDTVLTFLLIWGMKAWEKQKNTWNLVTRCFQMPWNYLMTTRHSFRVNFNE